MVSDTIRIEAVFPTSQAFEVKTFTSQSVDWLVLVMLSLVLQVTLTEPLILGVFVVVSTRVWTRPAIISECINRFGGIGREVDFREWMVHLGLVKRHVTFPVHHQAAPDSASLFNLHDKIYKALKNVLALPNVVFSTGVYWLLIYTVCILALVNLQADPNLTYRQSSHLYHRLGLPQVETEVTVSQIWEYVEYRLFPALSELHPAAAGHTPVEKLSVTLATPVRLRQIRVNKDVRPAETHAWHCSPIPRVVIDPKRKCNSELNSDNMETRHFANSWAIVTPYSQKQDRYTFSGSTEDRQNILFEEGLPESGYEHTMQFQRGSLQTLIDIHQSDWIDERTRYLFIDFTIINLETHIASCFQIIYDFKRSAPFQKANSLHFKYEGAGNENYTVAVLSLIFLFISGYNLIKELLMFFKLGIIMFLQRSSTYLEISKMLLAMLMCYIYFKKERLLRTGLRDLRVAMTSSFTPDHVDFREAGLLDRTLVMAGGVLVSICIFQIFRSLSKIRRLVIFNKMLLSTLTLFSFPVVVGLAFTFFSYGLFVSTTQDFRNFVISYLSVNQNFVKPQAIFKKLVYNHPYIGPGFFFLLGFSINFFIVNFFIVFLNEAYSAIKNQVRLQKYREKERTKLEFVYDFLGIKSTIVTDAVKEYSAEATAEDREFLTEIKRLQNM